MPVMIAAGVPNGHGLGQPGPVHASLSEGLMDLPMARANSGASGPLIVARG